jgi:hypothetical protein
MALKVPQGILDLSNALTNSYISLAPSAGALL